MPLLAFGGGVLEIPGSTQQPYAQTLGALTTEVANRLRGADDPDIRTVARRGVIWAAHYADLTREFTFGSHEPAQVLLIENDGTLALPANFVGMRLLTLEYLDYQNILPENVGEKAGVLDWLPWAQFNQLDHAVSGVPRFWSAQDTFTTGVIHINPRPDADSAARYAARMWLWSTVDVPAQDEDVLAAPKDYSEVLIEGGKAYLLRERTSDLQEKAFQLHIFETMISRYAAKERVRHGSRSAAWRVGGA